ncbi:head decoration protein [Roseospira goensis]|uniref:Head decoration protein n=1 Tax=Roseospira goensis TaxID=391922 RepID=A0A7W6S2F5_9PROT|nr:head decoration protein [Roseospira goensis]MBB4287673.1 hypothetical protein [Roseospira goensis]
MPNVITESRRTAEFLISEANGHRSREEVTVTGGAYTPGTVLGRVTTSGKHTIHDPTAEDGSETAVAVLHAVVDASDGDRRATIIARDAEVNGLALSWFDGATDPQKAAGVADLAAVGIIVR